MKIPRDSKNNRYEEELDQIGNSKKVGKLLVNYWERKMAAYSSHKRPWAFF
jgi:hypothetical protein